MCVNLSQPASRHPATPPSRLQRACADHGDPGRPDGQVSAHRAVSPHSSSHTCGSRMLDSSRLLSFATDFLGRMRGLRASSVWLPSSRSSNRSHHLIHIFLRTLPVQSLYLESRKRCSACRDARSRAPTSNTLLETGSPHSTLLGRTWIRLSLRSPTVVVLGG